MKRAVLVLGLLLWFAGPAWAQSDLTVQSFVCPGGANTQCFRVHASTTEAGLTLNGEIIATRGYKVAYVFAHTGSQVVADISNGAVPIAGSIADNALPGLSGALWQMAPTHGSIIAVAISSSGALTTGTAAHAEATVLSAGRTSRRSGLTSAIGAAKTFTQSSITTAARGVYRFQSDEAIGCNISTSTTIAPGTAQLVCTVIVVY